MNFVTKLIVATITIAATIVGSIWTGFEKIDGRMDDKVREAKVEVYDKINTLHGEGKALLKAQDEKFTVQIMAVNNNMVEMKKDIRSILILSRKAQAKLEKRQESYYTINEPTTSKGNHL